MDKYVIQKLALLIILVTFNKPQGVSIINTSLLLTKQEVSMGES